MQLFLPASKQIAASCLSFLEKNGATTAMSNQTDEHQPDMPNQPEQHSGSLTEPDNADNSMQEPSDTATAASSSSAEPQELHQAAGSRTEINDGSNTTPDDNDNILSNDNVNAPAADSTDKTGNLQNAEDSNSSDSSGIASDISDNVTPILTADTINAAISNEAASESKAGNIYLKPIIAFIACVLVLIVSSAYLIWHNTDIALHAAAQSMKQIEQCNTQLASTDTRLSQYIQDKHISEDILNTADYQAAHDAAASLYDDENDKASHSIDQAAAISWNEVAKARELQQSNADELSEYQQALHNLRQASYGIISSYESSQAEASKQALSDTIDSADSLISDTANENLDAALVNALTDTARTAKALRDSESTHTSSLYEMTNTALTTALNGLQTAHKQYQEAERLRQQQEEAERLRQAELAAQQASAASSGSSLSGSNGTANSTAYSSASSNTQAQSASAEQAWCPTYRGIDDRSAANADGSLGAYYPGLYIAHGWSHNGHMILSKPAHVIIDGISYHYVSCIYGYVGQGDMSDTYAYTSSNNGIGFGTCTGVYDNVGQQVIFTHYEPD